MKLNYFCRAEMLCLISMSFAFGANETRAGVIHVPGGFTTIQDAIDASFDGDEILVGPGTYIENIDFGGKSILVSAPSGPAVTIIDGGGVDSTVKMLGDADSMPELRGFTVRNGFSNDYGGGIRIGAPNAIIRGNVIEKNFAFFDGGLSAFSHRGLIADNIIRDNFGGGLSLSFSSSVVLNNQILRNSGSGIHVGGEGSVQVIGNLIAENRASDGGGIDLFAAGTPTIRGNVIRANSAISGGGISHSNVSNSLIVQNLIVGNAATLQGGGIEWGAVLGERGPRLVNNTIAYNDSPSGSGVFADGFDANTELFNNNIVALAGQTAVVVGDFNDQNAPMFFHNNLFSDGGLAYSGIGADPTGINGNVSLDPGFVRAVTGNFRLLANSGLIDIGANSAPDLPSLDFEGYDRIYDGNGDSTAIVDIGVYERIPEPSTASLILFGAACTVAIRLRSRSR